VERGVQGVVIDHQVTLHKTISGFADAVAMAMVTRIAKGDFIMDYMGL